jgi:hypothetical protein
MWRREEEIHWKLNLRREAKRKAYWMTSWTVLGGG